MQLIMTQPALAAPVNPDMAARQRADRLGKATLSRMHAALAFLSMIDPDAFEIAFTAVTPASSDGPGEPRDRRTQGGREGSPRTPAGFRRPSRSRRHGLGRSRCRATRSLRR